MVRTVGVAPAAEPMVNGTVAVADCADESSTEMTKEKLPLVIGVPEMMPVFGARVSPAGSCPEPMLQV